MDGMRKQRVSNSMDRNANQWQNIYAYVTMGGDGWMLDA